MIKRTRSIRLAVVGLLCLTILCRFAVVAPLRPRVLAAPSPPQRPATPFERALRSAWKGRSRALLAEIHQREAREQWDPLAVGCAEESLRRRALARDATGDLRQARGEVMLATVLALTPAEAHRAGVLRLLIERDLGWQKIGFVADWQRHKRGAEAHPVHTAATRGSDE